MICIRDIIAECNKKEFVEPVSEKETCLFENHQQQTTYENETEFLFTHTSEIAPVPVSCYTHKTIWIADLSHSLLFQFTHSDSNDSGARIIRGLLQNQTYKKHRIRRTSSVYNTLTT